MSTARWLSAAAALVLRAAGYVESELTPNPSNSSTDTDGHVRQLAWLAANTLDATVLQWAMAVCQRDQCVAECKALSARQLVVLAPEDGRNWLPLAVNVAGQLDVPGPARLPTTWQPCSSDLLSSV